jgi:hypothetical protein
MEKINVEKWICSMIEAYPAYKEEGKIPCMYKQALADQGLEYRNGEIVKKQSETKQEWSEEDETTRNRVICVIWAYANAPHCGINYDYAQKLENWLKSIRPQNRWKPSEQEKAALRTAIQVMTKERSFPLLGAHLQNILDAFEGESRVDWKPSKGQMEALKEACNEHYNPKGELYSLYEQLKAL